MIQLKQSDSDLMGVLPSLNIRGLAPAQLELFKILTLCIKMNEPFTIDLAASIYFNVVRNPNERYDKKTFIPWSQVHPIWSLTNGEIWEASGEPTHYAKRKKLEQIVLNWLKNSIGSLVVRGFLCTMPTFDSELVKNVTL